MGKKAPEVKTGINRGRRVYWVSYPCCGQPNGKDHVSKAGANFEKKHHQCDG